MYHYQRRENLLCQNFKNYKFLNHFERNWQSRSECFYFGLAVVVSGTEYFSDNETEILAFLLEFPVGSVGFREQYVTLASYATCWILLPALCLTKVWEVWAGQECEVNVKYGITLPPATWINEIHKQTCCTFKFFLSTQISQLAIHSFLSYLMWENFFFFTPGKCLEEKTCPAPRQSHIQFLRWLQGRGLCTYKICKCQYVAGWGLILQYNVQLARFRPLLSSCIGS